MRGILLEKPTCETRARDVEYSNAQALELELHSNVRLLELEITSSARTRGYVRYSYASNVGGLIAVQRLCTVLLTECVGVTVLRA